MYNKSIIPITLRVLSGVALILAVGLVAGCDSTDPEPDEIVTLRQATAPYQDVNMAIDDGFMQAEPCAENPNGPGALGVPFIQLDRLDTVIDPANPEVLFYEPQQNGDLELVGVEMIVPIEAWEEENNAPPSLLGNEFHRNEEAGLFGIHVWIWRDNPEGLFAFAHPDVSCQYAEE